MKMVLRSEMHHGRVVRCPVERPANVNAMFGAAVARARDKEAVVDGDLRLTYGALDGLVGRTAGRLRGLGLAEGDRVALLLGNRADFLVLLLAASRLGLIIVPLNIRQSRDEIAYALNDSGAALLFAEQELHSRLPDAATILQCREVVLVDDGARVWEGGYAPVAEPVQLNEDAAFALLYTSGTTGRPKGAVLTHLGVVVNGVGSAEALGLQDGDSIILAVPASHVTGMQLLLLQSVLVAGKIVLMRQFKAEDFLQLAEKERLTYTIIVPAMYKLCLMEPGFAEYDLSTWRVGAFGGAPMPVTTIDELAARLPDLSLVNIYGATETTAPAVMMPPAEIRNRLSQVGRALPFCDILIMDEEGRELPPGESGEVWIAGPVVIPNYWENPEADAAAFVGGYWRSGDLGAMDADGFLSIFDRKKDMINRGGYKIYSVEVENTLMRHEAVVEAAVVARPCPVLGERIAAFVVAKTNVAPDELQALCAEWLSDYKVPDYLKVVPGPLPRNANGKLLKTEMRDWAMEYFTTARA